MGAAASCSPSTVKTTRVLRVPEYSKLAPRHLTLDTFHFRGQAWRVTALSVQQGFLSVSVDPVDKRKPRSAPSTHVSIEVLDGTGEHSVFRTEHASSCVHGGCYTVRCTLSASVSKWRLKNFSSSKPAPPPAMAGSNTMTVGSFSRLKATLRGSECAYSTQFSVAGSVWYLALCPGKEEECLLVNLGRESSLQSTPETAEFSFQINCYESEKMTHTFDRFDFTYTFRYELASARHEKSLIVRCRLAVVRPETAPSLPAAAVSATTVVPCAESVLTPLLSAMYA